MHSLSFIYGLRVLAAILLVVAIVRSAFEIAFSFRTEIQTNADVPGTTIDHFFAINSVTVLIGLAGILLFVLSSRKTVQAS